MSQHPPPYSPPPGPQQPYPYPYYSNMPAGDPLAPAKRASVLMFIVGGLCLSCGLCTGITVAVVPMEQVTEQLPPEVAAELDTTLLQRIYIIIAAASAGIGLLFLILGYYVRKGSKGAIIATMVCSALLLLLILLQIAGALVQQQAIGALCVGVVPVALLVILWMFLLQALQAAPQVQNLREQQQIQYWQYQQQQQAYMQGGQYPPPPPGPYVQQPSVQQQPPPPPPPPDMSGPDEPNR